MEDRPVKIIDKEQIAATANDKALTVESIADESNYILLALELHETTCSSLDTESVMLQQLICIVFVYHH